jgi:hypothetical protein
MPVLGILDRQTNGDLRCHGKFIRTHRPARAAYDAKLSLTACRARRSTRREYARRETSSILTDAIYTTLDDDPVYVRDRTNNALSQGEIRF